MAVTNKARVLREAGEPVIGFGAGEPDSQHLTTSLKQQLLLAVNRQITVMDQHPVSQN